MDTTRTMDVSTLSDLELMEQMTNGTAQMASLERQARQAQGQFQQKAQLLSAQLNIFQTEINARIARKNGTAPAPVEDNLSASRKMQRMKNQQEEHKKNFPPAGVDGANPARPDVKTQ